MYYDILKEMGLHDKASPLRPIGPPSGATANDKKQISLAEAPALLTPPIKVTPPLSGRSAPPLDEFNERLNG